MDINELFGRGKPVFSFEFFLPKTPESTASFINGVRQLKTLNPSFVTLTYDAGGSTRERTVVMAGRLRNELGLETACHLTCIAHTRVEIHSLLDQIEAQGIRHLVALRGDVPRDHAVPPPEERDFGYARDLVGFIKKRGGFQTAVAGYPETHSEAESPQADLDHLLQKVRAGADWVITQLFFDNRDYFSFVRRAREIGITVPIVPGIMPVTNFSQLQRFTTLCGAKIPPAIASALEVLKDDQEAILRYGIEYSFRQCRELLAQGAPGIHFYTLNRSQSTFEILTRLRKL